MARKPIRRAQKNSGQSKAGRPPQNRRAQKDSLPATRRYSAVNTPSASETADADRADRGSAWPRRASHDGLAIILLALAILAALAQWFSLPGILLDALRLVMEGAIGICAYACPLAFLAGSIILFRRKKQNFGRIYGAVLLMFIAMVGIFHIAMGLPDPTLGFDPPGAPCPCWRY